MTGTGSVCGTFEWASGVMVADTKGRAVVSRSSILVVSASTGPSKAFTIGPQEKPIWLPGTGA